MSGILILTATRDIHARAVEWAIRQLGGIAHIWIGTDFPTKSTCTICIDSATGLRISTNSPSGQLRNVCVSGIWRRRDVTSIVGDELHPSDKAVASKECLNFREGLNFTLDDSCRFAANSYLGAIRARSKALQLKLAVECGFRIPKTILTNSSEDIREMFHGENGNVILKSFTSPTWASATTSYFAYASKLNSRLLANRESLEAAPAIYQSLISKKYEVRALFMGRSYLAVRLDSQTSAVSVHDWRAGSTALIPIQRIHLPSDIVDKCISLMQKLGIVTGSFDFAVTEGDEYVFFEINEQGQFLWMEERAPDVPVLQVFSKFLISGDPNFEWDEVNDNNISFHQYLASGNWQRIVSEEPMKHVQVETRRPYTENLGDERN